MKKIGTALLCAALAIGLAGCGTSTVPGGQANTSGTAESQKAMTKTEAGKYYLDLIKPSNDTIDAYAKAVSSKDVPEATRLSGTIAKQYTTAIKKIQERKWPPSAQKYADALVSDLENEKPVFEKISKASTYDDIVRMENSIKSNGSSKSLREVLGLDEASSTSPITVTSGRFSGDDGYGYLNGIFTVKNDLTVPVNNVTVTVSFLDKSGNSISEAYPQVDLVQPGQSADVQWTISTSENSVVSAKATIVSWSTESDGSDYQKAAIEGPIVKIR